MAAPSITAATRRSTPTRGKTTAPGIPRPEYKKHDWGYTIGGPVYIPHVYNNDKKKTFFFWSQEWRHEIQPGTTISQAVPSDAERTGNFNDVCPVYTGAAFDPGAFPDCPSQPNMPAGTPFLNNTLPTPFASTAAAMLSLIPQANNLSGVNGNYASGQAAGTPLPSYVANPSYPTTWREELIRVDHNLTDSQRLTFRYIHDTWSTINQGPLWGQYNNTFDNTNTNFAGPTTSFVARLTSNFTPTLLNEFVASYTDDHIFLTNVGTNVNLPEGGIDLVPLFANGLGGKIPAFAIGATNNGVAYGGGFNVDTGYFPWKNANPTYSYRDIMTKIINNHTLFFGGYFVAAQKNQGSSLDVQGQLSFAASSPNTTGNPFADMLVSSVGGYTQDQKNLYYYDRYKILEPFIQDDWRVTRKLTLNLGLRWSIYGRYQEKNDQEFGFSPNAYNALAATSQNVHAQVAVKSRDLSTPHDFLAIAELYRTRGRLLEAITWCERGWEAFKDRHAQADDLRELLPHLYFRSRQARRRIAAGVGAIRRPEVVGGLPPIARSRQTRRPEAARMD